MSKDIKKRTIAEAKYIIKNWATVRETAFVFKVSKSTVYKDVAERLKEYDIKLAQGVYKVLMKNKTERHIRGGKATKIKYSSKS